MHFGNLTLLSWQQTSTADMLDSVVEYIKDLQEQVQVLNTEVLNRYFGCITVLDTVKNHGQIRLMRL